MNFLKLVKTRKSVRKYLAQEVEQEKLNYIMECARLAPSAANRQPWFFYIVKRDDLKDVLYKCYHSKWFSTNPAPLYIVACGDEDKSWKRNYDGKTHQDIDVSIAFEHICLAAAEQGLGTCWICHFDPKELKTLMNLPTNLYPIAMTPIGYPTTNEPHIPSRKSIQEISKII